MANIDQLEKGGRLLVWVVLSGVLVITFGVVPMKLVKNDADEAILRGDLKKALERIEELANPRVAERITIDSMRPLISGPDFSANRRGPSREGSRTCRGTLGAGRQRPGRVSPLAIRPNRNYG